MANNLNKYIHVSSSFDYQYFFQYTVTGDFMDLAVWSAWHDDVIPVFFSLFIINICII